jgi:formylglycine-generating enzyme required for sulfatase activity
VPEITNSVGMRFALITPGKFWMGSPENEADREKNEGPRHEVEITRPYWLGVFPVTQGKYEKATGKNPATTGRQIRAVR